MINNPAQHLLSAILTPSAAQLEQLFGAQLNAELGGSLAPSLAMQGLSVNQKAV
jgi:hypothetical protein